MLRVLELLERGAVACVVVRDVARLTRDEFNADIGLIARACYHSGAVIVTREKVYNPADPSDQLMLGLQGLLAGWDRANTVRRLDHHRRVKQSRGTNINGAVPAGYDRVLDMPRTSPEHGKLRLTADEAVRDQIALILGKGLELGGVLAVVRYLHAEGLLVPVMRSEGGRRAIEWVQANRSRVTYILKNPTFAGAVVNGRRRREVDRATGRARWSTRRGYETCTVIRDAHPGYITWEQHHHLLAAIAHNNQAKGFGDGAALLSGLALLRCGVCGLPLVVKYNNPRRIHRGRAVPNTPYTYSCTGRHSDGRQAMCQTPAGPHIDRAMRDLALFALGELDLAGAADALRDRDRRAAEEGRRRLERVSALARRAEMLEEAIAEAGRADARARLVARFETALAELEQTRAAAAAPATDPQGGLTPALVARLEVFCDPRAAWLAFTPRTRKQVLRALAERVTIYPDLDGYVVVADWQGGGRAAAKVTTIRRRKVYPVPEDVLALFDGSEAVRSIAGCSGTAPRRERASPRPDGAGCHRRSVPRPRSCDAGRGTAAPARARRAAAAGRRPTR
jgi:DNA invertase Pin-like site-specific DNA recombinase